MKRLGLLAFVFALALVLVLVWTLTRESAPRTEPGSAAATATGSSPERPADPGLAGLEASAPSADEAQRLSVAEHEHAGGGLETWDADRSVWVEGVVRAPAGCADEGPIEVFATSEAVDPNRLDGLLRAKKPARVLLARRTVDALGAFRIPFPPDTKVAYVTVRGRYQYLDTSETIDLAAAPAPLALDPKCGAWITGTVGLPADPPVALADLDGLKITLRTSVDSFRGNLADAKGLRRSAELAAGKFEFRAVPAEIEPILETEPERLAAASQRLEKLAAGREHPVRLDLLRGGAIRGLVRDADGAPLSGAKVVASRLGQWFGFDNREVREATSDASGAFDLAAVTPGKVVLTADLEGYLQSDRKTVDLQDGGSQSGVELAISRGNTISGRVSWADGKPAEGMEVRVEFDLTQMVGMKAFNMLRGRDGKAKSDAKGQFAVSGLGEGPFVVDARGVPGAAGAAKPAGDAPEAPDLEDGPEKTLRPGEWGARIEGVAPGTTGLELVLREPESLAGRVQDEAGLPVTKFRIEAVREGKGPLGVVRGTERKSSFEDPEGRFRIESLTEGTWKLYAIADGFGMPEPVAFDVPRGKEAPELVVTIVHAASVAGTVKAPGGQPISGAKVTIETEGPGWQAMLQGGPKPPVATTESDGTFLLDGLRAGVTKLVATSDSYAKSLPVEVTLEVAKRVDGVEIVLRAGGVLTGEVFGDTGRPASGLLVQATQLKDFDTQMTFSDGGGEFKIEHLVPGSWQIVAMPTRGDREEVSSEGKEPTDGMMDMISKMKMAVVTIAEGEETHVVLGAPPKDPVEVHGTVTHAGSPMGGAMLAFVADGNGLKGLKTTKVKEDGAYSVRLDAPGHYSISVQRGFGGMGEQSTVEFSEDIPEAKEHELDLVMPDARISGLVLDPEGHPAAGARISVHPETSVEAGTMWGGQYHEGVTDGEGRYDVQMLRPGTYVVGAGGTTMAGLFGDENAFGRQMRGGLKLSEGEWMKDVDFRLKKSGALEVTVVDGQGSPVAEAAVFVREADGRLVDGFSMVSTKGDGKARYPGLGPGNYTVSARKDLLASIDSARVKVVESESAAVQVALQPGTMLIVTTVGNESAPVRASISVQDEDGREVGTMFSLAEVMKMFGEGGVSSSEHKVGPLPQGKYKVKATSAGGQTVTKPVSLTGQAERKLTIHFD